MRPRATSPSTFGAGEHTIDLLLIAVRTLHYAATASLVGTFTFWCLVARPAFRQTGTASALEARLDRSFVALAWASLLLALVSGVAWLIVVASQMSGAPIDAVLSQGVVGIVLRQTQFGEDWALRGAFIIVLAACLVAQRRRGKRVARWIALAISAAFIATLAWAGHGAVAGELPFDFLHLPADLLHLLAAGAWLGALVPLGVLLAKARRDGSLESLATAQRATARFSTLGVTCVATLLVTGVVNTWFLAGTIPALIGTPYGQLLLVKVAVFVGMIAIANLNRSRIMPRLGHTAVVRQLARNVLMEASLGVLVLAIVGIIGILPPGLHTEPRWPLPFRFDLAEIAVGARKALDIAAILFALCVASVAIAVAWKHYRAAFGFTAALLVCGGVAGTALQPSVVRAYPTSYYASTKPYAAPSVARGAPLYFANCAACHGADGRGDGLAAANLPIRPADLTAEHLFAHKVGDIFWWVSYGRDKGVMPGFAHSLSPELRWDLVNFVLARAAGVQTNAMGSQVATAAAPLLPDFAFEQRGRQKTLNQTLKAGPVLLVLFTSPAQQARFAHLAAAGLSVIAVEIDRPTENAPPPVVEVSGDVRSTLALFHAPKDGRETELMLDRNGSVRARWTTSGGLADTNTLLADAVRVANIPVAAANHAGHGG